MLIFPERLPYKMMTVFCLSVLSFGSAAFSQNSAAVATLPVVTDSRIKTFVYNENDVYDVVTHYGYQCNVEFGLNESVETISLGDRVPFEVIPAGRRLFIRATTTNARTNMTVVTNKRAYQFDLASVPAPMTPNEELVYVVRFFYPSEAKKQMSPFPEKASFSSPTAVASTPGEYNYKYTFSGSDMLAPLKIFDDGRSTYFKFPPAISGTPSIFTVDESGKETMLLPRSSGEYLVVDNISPRFAIKQGKDTVMVYNEKISRN